MRLTLYICFAWPTTTSCRSRKNLHSVIHKQDNSQSLQTTIHYHTVSQKTEPLLHFQINLTILAKYQQNLYKSHIVSYLYQHLLMLNQNYCSYWKVQQKPVKGSKIRQKHISIQNVSANSHRAHQLIISAKVNVVNVRGDYEIGRSVCVSVCVYDDSSSSPHVIHNRQERWRPPVNTSTFHSSNV